MRDRLHLQAGYGCVQFIKGEFAGGGGDFRAEPAHGITFIDDEQAAGALEAGHDGRQIQRHNRARIDDLA